MNNSGKGECIGWCDVFYNDYVTYLTTGMDPGDISPKEDSECIASGFVFLHDSWVKVDVREKADLSKIRPLWIPKDHVRSIWENPEADPTLGTKWAVCSAHYMGIKSPYRKCMKNVVPGYDKCKLHLKLDATQS